MIRKNKKCIECGREDLPHFSNKRCIYCAKIAYAQKTKPNTKKERNIELDDFFDEKIKLSSKHPYSYESGRFIKEVTRKNICHLLPKRTYKSVESHPDNFVLLTFEEHTRFDDLLDKFRFEDLTKEFPRSLSKLIEFVQQNRLILENKKLKNLILEL